MNISTKVPCPNCGSKKNKQIPGHQLQCNKCGTVHDGKPFDYGRALHHNPVRNAIILENQENGFQNRPKRK